MGCLCIINKGYICIHKYKCVHLKILLNISLPLKPKYVISTWRKYNNWKVKIFSSQFCLCRLFWLSFFFHETDQLFWCHKDTWRIMFVVVVQSSSHVRLFDLMDCSMPDLPVPHHLPKFASTPKFMSIASGMPSCNLILWRPQSFPASGTFPMSQNYVCW